MNAKYHFISAVRQGIAGEINEPDTLGDGVPSVAELSMYVRVNDKGDSPKMRVRLHGPGDVTSISRLAIIRTDPAPWTRDFEPNYFPQIDFGHTDFPWKFIPAKMDEQGRLRPWVCLVVVRKQEGVSLTYPSGQPLPVLSLQAPAKPMEELPDLSESWAWAHAQVTGTGDGSETVGDLLTKKPNQNLSRLICPRKLEPKKDYIAALVPAFEAGRKTGLGISLQQSDEDTLQPAWLSGAGAPAAIDLPVYYHWEFSTGEAEDFLALVRKLEYHPLPESVGSRPMTVRNLPYGLPDVGTVALEGALRPVKLRAPKNNAEPGWLFDLPVENQTDLDAEGIPASLAEAILKGGIALSEYCFKVIDTPGQVWRISDGDKTYHLQKIQNQIKVSELPQAFIEKLRDVLNIPAIQAADQDPIIGPPIYGGIQAAQATLPTIGLPSWLNELNLDPRLRAAAGMGTLVVQDRQDELMEVAWTQLSEKRQRETLGQLQLGREVSTAILNKHLYAGADETEKTNTLLKKVAPLYRRFYLAEKQSKGIAANAKGGGAPVSLWQTIHASHLPTGAFSTAYRRLGKPNGAVAKRLGVLSKPGSMWSVTQMAQKPALIIHAAAAQPFLVNMEEMKAQIPKASSDKVAERFRKSAGPLFNLLKDLDQKAKDAPMPILMTNNDLGGIRTSLLAEINPDRSFLVRAGKLEAGASVGSSKAAVLAKETLPQTSDPLDASLNAPVFDYPTYRFLQDISQDYLLPGAELFPDNALTILETNPEFIASFMVGLNHEMSRELLWRDYPVNPRATYFQQFWDSLDQSSASKQIEPVRDWAADQPLGAHLQTGGQGDQLVILIRGDLMRRFPSAQVSAMPYENGRLAEDKEVEPLFQGRIDPDLYFFGFPLQEETIREQGNWHFIIQQQPTQPRFGLNTPAGEAQFGKIPGSKSELSWGHLVSSQQELDALTHVSLKGPLKKNTPIGAQKWGYNAAHMALLTLRKAVRIAIPAHMILPPVQTEK